LYRRGSLRRSVWVGGGRGGRQKCWRCRLNLDDRVGSLKPDKEADIVTWERDPCAIPAADLQRMQCEMTLFRGAIVYRAPGSAVTVKDQ